MHGVAGFGQRIRQRYSQSAGRKIRDPANLVNRLIARAASDDYIHGKAWQAAKCSGEISRNGGISRRQTSRTSGHRVWNGHPGSGFKGEGRSPATFARVVSVGRNFGTAASNA